MLSSSLIVWRRRKREKRIHNIRSLTESKLRILARNKKRKKHIIWLKKAGEKNDTLKCRFVGTNADRKEKEKQMNRSDDIQC